jgi:CubicO group peptidase (beta-lactamase class C family)
MVSKTDLAVAFEQIAQVLPLSGAILVTQDGEVVFEQAYGFASRQLNVPNTLNTRFPIASLTKMFTAMTALMLVEQGHIALDERPATYLPALAALDPGITLHHLLSHTSGVQDIYGVPQLHFAMQRLRHEQGDLLTYLVNLPQVFPPGQGWQYSSTGYLMMGYLMEHVTGVTFAELLRRSVLAPLAMADTGIDVPRRINPGRAAGHACVHGELVNAENDRLSIFPEAPGELYSTVHDLRKWCDALFACPLVSPRTLALMFTPYGQVNASRHYGYGWFLTPRYRMHGGGTPGFISHLRQYPEQRLSIIVLLNSDQTNPDVILDAVEPLFAD